MSAGKVFKRKRSIDKYIRRASASKKVRQRKVDLCDSSLDSSGDFRLNLSSDEEDSLAASHSPSTVSSQGTTTALTATLDPITAEDTNPGAFTAPAESLCPIAVPAASRDPSSPTPAASPGPIAVPAASLDPTPSPTPSTSPCPGTAPAPHLEDAASLGPITVPAASPSSTPTASPGPSEKYVEQLSISLTEN